MKLEWISNVQFLSAIRYRGLKFALVIQETREGFDVIALETTGNDLESVLDNHAHDSVGTYESLSDAKKSAEEYAEKWVEQRRSAKSRTKKKCECKPIKKAAAP